MKVRDIMSRSVSSIQATEPIGNAAQAMADCDVGALPVLDGQKLVGIVTDRDITVRGVATGIGSEEPVRLVMTKDITTCSPDTDIEDALETMANEQVRRLPVCSENNELVGVVALADAALRDPDKREVADALSDISKPSSGHRQQPILA